MWPLGSSHVQEMASGTALSPALILPAKRPSSLGAIAFSWPACSVSRNLEPLFVFCLCHFFVFYSIDVYEDYTTGVL